MPVAAQETVEVDLELGVEITFTGNIHFDADGNVYIDGYFLAPAGVISPSLLAEGQYVEVTGIFLNDDTFKLTGIDTEVEEPTCDSTGATADTTDDCPTEPTCDSTGATADTADDCPSEPICDSTGVTADTADDCPSEPTCDSTGVTADTADDCPSEPTCDSTGVTADTADDCLPEEECTPNGHPVAARLADAFDVSPCEVEAQHDAGNGFGNIAKAYLLAEAYNQALLDGLLEGEEIDPTLLLDAQAYLDMHAEGMGWGQIVKASGVHPSDLAPGKLKKRAANDDDSENTTDTTTEPATTETNTNGNGKNNNGNNGNGNNGNENSNNGNGNSNANANSNNGNSNGNNGNNGNGNGNNGNGNSKDKNKDKGKKNK